MVYPNSYCIGFCYWMLNTSWQQLTPTRLTLITAVYNAAVAGTSVTTTQYNNFTQVTSWRIPYYEAYLKNQLPFSTPPVGTCDAWLSASGITRAQTNLFGICEFNGSVTRCTDILGGSVYGINALPARQPNFVNIPNWANSPNSFSFNVSGLQNFQLQNALALTQNKTGYTVFVVAAMGATGTARTAFYFSSGTSAAALRIGLGVNTAGSWVGSAKRLDGDAQATLSGSAVTGSFEIICFVVNYNTGAGTIYTNGAQVNTNAALVSTGSTSNTASVAASIGSLNQGSIWNGLMFDCLAFQTALSSADVLTITGWLNGLRSIY